MMNKQRPYLLYRWFGGIVSHYSIWDKCSESLHLWGAAIGDNMLLLKQRCLAKCTSHFWACSFSPWVVFLFLLQMLTLCNCCANAQQKKVAAQWSFPRKITAIACIWYQLCCTAHIWMEDSTVRKAGLHGMSLGKWAQDSSDKNLNQNHNIHLFFLVVLYWSAGKLWEQ